MREVHAFGREPFRACQCHRFLAEPTKLWQVINERFTLFYAHWQTHRIYFSGPREESLLACRETLLRQKKYLQDF